MSEVKTGMVALYFVPRDLLEYFRPDESGCCAALISGVSEDGSTVNLWVYPNTPGVSPMIRMNVEMGEEYGQWCPVDMQAGRRTPDAGG